jgi:hypothetical protein
MATDLTPILASRTIDLSGLPEAVVEQVQKLVHEAREKQASGATPPVMSAREQPVPLPESFPKFISEPRPTPEEFDRLLDELAAGPTTGKVLPPDFSRADIYDDHD